MDHWLTMYIKSSKATARFGVSLPDLKGEAGYLELERDAKRNCTVSIHNVDCFSTDCHPRDRECSINVRTFLGRILPSCGHTKQGTEPDRG